MKAVTVAVTLFLFAIVLVKARELGCPEDVSPCICENDAAGHYVVLTCSAIRSSEILGNVFTRSKNYGYAQVILTNSTIQYIPISIFDNVEITEMHLMNVVITQVFEKPPKESTWLRTLKLHNTRVLRGLVWKMFEPLTELTYLQINNSPIRVIKTDMSQYVSHTLETLSFHNTGVKRIKSGAFQDYTNLRHLTITTGGITELTRDVFPLPSWSSILVLDFTDQKLQSIPTDLFTDMPNLNIVILSKNQMATLPESAFEGSSKLQIIEITDNPLKCDCQLRWMIRRNLQFVEGYCSSPKELHDTRLGDLTENDFHCAK